MGVPGSSESALCPRCGSRPHPGASYCPTCGTQLGTQRPYHEPSPFLDLDAGQYTDDTQMMLCVAQQIVEDGGSDAAAMFADCDHVKSGRLMPPSGGAPRASRTRRRMRRSSCRPEGSW